MRFPAPSETFARLEVRGLIEGGCHVSASALRSAHPRAEALLAEHDLTGLAISHGGLRSWFMGLMTMFRHPLAVSRVVTKLVGCLRERPGQILIAFTLMPRAFGIANELRGKHVTQVHLFWGHFPSLVGLVLKALGSHVPVSLFLGAYDLVRGFPPSRLLALCAPVTTHARVNVAAIEGFTGLKPDRIHVIHRGIRVPPKPDDDSRPFPPKILVVERLVAPKRTAESIAVFHRVLATIGDASLCVLGDGPERRNIDDLVSSLGLDEVVEVRGHVAPEEVRIQMARAHVFLSMTQSAGERLPNAAKEAMAARCPVVIAHTPGIEELVFDSQSGYIVPPGAIETAAARVIDLLRDVRRRESFAQRAHEHVASHFDIIETTRQRLSFWKISVDSDVAADHGP